MKAVLLSELVRQFGGALLGEDIEIKGVASLETAQRHHLSFLSNPKFKKQLQTSQAGGIIVSSSEGLPALASGILTPNPYLYFAKVARFFSPLPEPIAGIHPTAVIDPTAIIPRSCEIGAHVVIGKNTRLGERCSVRAGGVIGDGVEIGSDNLFYPNVTIYDRCVLGDRIILHSGAVIGSDGFGLAPDENRHWYKIVQTGRVVIGSDIEIGANTTIDRGALEDTVLEDGVKLDNQIQIAHNVHIGAHTAMAGCVGVAGSTKIGRHCTFGGSAMILGHLTICDHTHISAGTLVGKSILKSGQYTGSFPVARHEDWLNNAAPLRHLGAWVHRIQSLEARLASLESSQMIHQKDVSSHE